ncbi:hypothetical protein PV327_010172 [Microctonus hyperodae]|uniref:Uncharacterized protein n=1 Tax=Microctonus hyperodae TaxID=165561 RepID=A0AA39FRY7_MICHY|nr:hypothetical protein PV327_010172 [Microctonus hyperodae]
MPLASKKDFIEQWLGTQNNVFHCENASDDLPLSHISDSFKLKRNRTSPSRNLRKTKHFKSSNEEDKSSSSLKGQIGINSLLQSTESRIYKNNAGQLQRCRVSIRDLPKTATRQQITFTSANTMKSVSHHSSESCKIIHNQKTVDQIINDVKSESPNITDIESLSPSSSVLGFFDDSIESESPKKLDIESPIFSPQNVNSQSGLSSIIRPNRKSTMNIDEDKTMSLMANDVNLDLSFSIRDSESDTGSVFSKESRTILSVVSSHSNETFFTQSNLSNYTIIKDDNGFQSSPIIPEDCIGLRNSKTEADSVDEIIDIENVRTLRSSKLENSNCPITLNTLIKKKKKHKKGSLVGQLRTLITGQSSFFRIWRHQLAKKDSEIQNKPFIILKIIHCTWKFNRQCLFGSVISDMHNLLDSIFQKFPEPHKMNNVNSLLSKKVITVLTTPEIVGTININKTRTLKIYPPWEVVDANKYVLSISHFHNIIHNFTSVGNNTKLNNEINQKFDCSCLAANQLVKSCITKFTGVKPNSTRYLFEV